VAVLLSAKVAEYEDALKGFRETTPHTIVAVFDMDGDLDRGRKQLAEIDEKVKPDLVFAVGIWALQAVVILAAAVADPVKVKLLLERAAEVFGVPEGVLSRGVALRRQRQGIETPVRVAVREQRRGEASVEKELLRSLLHAPQALDQVRTRISPEDFGDPVTRSLAGWVWEGTRDWPGDDPAAVLGRELELSGTEAMDWHAEAIGAAQRMVVRRLKHEQRERMNQLKVAAAQDEQTRLMQEIDEIARQLHELTK